MTYYCSVSFVFARLTDVEVVGEADVDAGDTDTAEVPHGLNALVDDFAGMLDVS